MGLHPDEELRRSLLQRLPRLHLRACSVSGFGFRDSGLAMQFEFRVSGLFRVQGFRVSGLVSPPSAFARLHFGFRVSGLAMHFGFRVPGL